MWLIDLIFGIGDLIYEIIYAKRFGWGSFCWNLAWIACLIFTVSQFQANHYILGIAGIAGTVACLVMGCRRIWQDIRSEREYEAWKREQENKKEN